MSYHTFLVVSSSADDGIIGVKSYSENHTMLTTRETWALFFHKQNAKLQYSKESKALLCSVSRR